MQNRRLSMSKTIERVANSAESDKRSPDLDQHCLIQMRCPDI